MIKQNSQSAIHPTKKPAREGLCLEGKLEDGKVSQDSSGRKSIEAWIRRETHRRRINIGATVAFSVAAVTFAAISRLSPSQLVLGTLAIFSVLFIFVGMINVCFLALGPCVDASDEEIREAAVAGPRWFKKLLQRLETLVKE